MRMFVSVTAAVVAALAVTLYQSDSPVDVDGVVSDSSVPHAPGDYPRDMASDGLLGVSNPPLREAQSSSVDSSTSPPKTVPPSVELTPDDAGIASRSLASYQPEVDLDTVLDSDMALIEGEIMRLKRLEVEEVARIKSSIDWASEGIAAPANSSFMESEDLIRIYSSIGHGETTPLYVEAHREQYPVLFSIRDNAIQLFNDPVYRSYRRSATSEIVKKVLGRTE